MKWLILQDRLGIWFLVAISPTGAHISAQSPTLRSFVESHPEAKVISWSEL